MIGALLGFEFRWLVEQDMAIYTIVIAAVWQSSGFVMALFLAGLRGVDDNLTKAAKIDGASTPRLYWHIILPLMRPVFFSAIVILTHIAIKSFDLVQALTGEVRDTLQIFQQTSCIPIHLIALKLVLVLQVP